MKNYKVFLKLILIPFLLLSIWLLLSLFYSSYKSFTILQYPQGQNFKNDFTGKELFQGQNISGTFIAKENDFGIIAVKFGNLQPVDPDTQDIILFRIKEKGSSSWYYENKYGTLSIKSNQYYTFGFKPINASKGKEYIFQIVSLNGNKDNALTFSDTNPLYFTKYKFEKSELFKNRNSLENFLAKKIITFFADTDALLSSSVFLLPFIFYLTLLLIPKFLQLSDSKHREYRIRNLIFRRKFFAYVVITLVFMDIFFFKTEIIGITIGLVGFWIVAIFINRFESRITFILAFVCLLYALITTYFKFLGDIDTASTLFYFFLILGFTQIILETKSIKLSFNFLKK